MLKHPTIKRTLNSWEATTLEQLLSLSSEILYSGFDNPETLQTRLLEISIQIESEDYNPGEYLSVLNTNIN